MFGDAGSDVLCGDSGNDALEGGTESDTLVGDDGHDSLLGGDGDDALSGGLGHHYLDGQGHSRDTLNGGSGMNVVLGLATEIDLAFALMPDWMDRS